MFPTENRPAWQLWAGRIQAILISLVFVFSACLKLGRVPMAVTELTHAGIPGGAILPIGLLELSCLALYLIPRTAILGTLALSAYLGGAIVTHIVARQPFIAPLVVGVMMLMSAWLRHRELRRLIPLRASAPERDSYESNWAAQAERGIGRAS